MAYENKAGLNVNNQYGARASGGALGRTEEDGHIATLVYELTGEMINTALSGGYVPPVVVPKGALFTRAFLRVDEAFALTGTTPAVSIGAVGSLGTDYISLSQAELQAVGTKKPASTGNGTWSQASATGTTANSKVGIALTGTTPAVTTGVGKASLVLEFVNVTKV